MLNKFAAGITAVVFAATLGACGSTNDGKSQAENTTQASSQSTSQKKADQEIPNLKSKTLFEAITELRDRGVRYEVSGKHFEHKTESNNTRSWIVEDQKTVNDGQGVELKVAKKSD